MGEKQKNNGKKTRAFLVALFFAFALNIFVSHSAFAAKGDVIAVPADRTTTTAKAQWCAASTSGVWNGTQCKDSGTDNVLLGTEGAAEAGIVNPTTPPNVTCSPPSGGLDVGGSIGCIFKMILYGIFTLFGFALTAATALFAWVIDAKNISGGGGILNNDAIKNVWIMVRDTLNMFFILVLLFAAFCTIFQVEKWNLKKVWLNILINALLVNFSFTIARFIMDIANVMMYYFFANMFGPSMQSGGSSIMAAYGGATGIANLLIPQKVNLFNADWTYLIAAIIFMAIFAVTLMVVAAMFVIRLIALAIIVMFSPIGFVGYIFPATGKFADDWWSALFKYSFFGPIMAFMMAVSLQMMNAFGSAGLANNMKAAAQINIPANSTITSASFIASMAFYFIPIIILWIAMGISQSMGIAGAGAVVGAAKKFAKSGLMSMSGANYLKKNYQQYKAKRDERQKEIDKKRWGGTFGNWANNKQDKLYANSGIPILNERGQKRHDKRIDIKNKEDIKEATEKHDSTTEAELHANISNMDSASVSAMSNKTLIDSAGQVRQALSRGAKYEKEVEDNIKKGAGAAGFSVDEIDPEDLRRMSPGDAAAAKEKQKQQKERRDKWVQNEKIKHMDQARAVIKAAEERGKIKTTPPAPAPFQGPVRPTV